MRWPKRWGSIFAIVGDLTVFGFAVYGYLHFIGIVP